MTRHSRPSDAARPQEPRPRSLSHFAGSPRSALPIASGFRPPQSRSSLRLTAKPERRPHRLQRALTANRRPAWSTANGVASAGTPWRYSTIWRHAHRTTIAVVGIRHKWNAAGWAQIVRAAEKQYKTRGFFSVTEAAQMHNDNYIQVSYFGQTLWLPASGGTAFYSDLSSGKWEPKTFAMLASQLDRDTAYIDIGGWIGLLAFWAEKIAGKVIIVEPDPRCYEILLGIKERNGSNAEIINAALSSERRVRLNAVGGFGSSESSILPLASRESVEVPCVSFSSLMAKTVGRKACVKIDIEGYEYFLTDELKSMGRPDVKSVYVSLHPALFRKALDGSLFRKNIRVAARTWAFRNAIPNFKLKMTWYNRFRFMRYCFRKCLFKRSGPGGYDLLFLPC
jgi:FkbM family methyltransferase